ncbi:MAG: hypothetical protein FD176_860 [Rhodospirillaceae bacterium]|nr:MAG: hypothetical protein FD176_860 [Rhodospirillaceae bacterium]TNC97876.1 MAG: hypothetical protein FD119_864 [Stygiobacter sp.]
MREQARMVYVTAPSHDVALALAEAVVGERLAACANILGAITSVYWWDGKLNRDGEVAMVLKTMATHIPALTERIRQLHPYECPCIVAIPIDGGNPDFITWIAAETGSR